MLRVYQTIGSWEMVDFIFNENAIIWNDVGKIVPSSFLKKFVNIILLFCNSSFSWVFSSGDEYLLNHHLSIVVYQSLYQFVYVLNLKVYIWF